MKKKPKKNFALSFIAWVLFIAALVVVLPMLWFCGAIVKQATFGHEWCDNFSLVANKTECVGRDMSMMQGHLRYSEIRGSPHEEQCKTLLSGGVVGELKPHACPAWDAGPWTCFAHERDDGGDITRVLYGFTKDCREVRAWSSENVDYASMPAKIAKER
jgi:hypothetical protein